MSTCNYYTTEEWAPLVVYESDDADDEAMEAEAVSEAAREFSDGLRWYRVEIRGGYYAGLQFDALKTEDGDMADGIDDETARDWYNMTAQEIEADMARERRAIKNWLRGWIGCGWRELGVAGVFSNGEAVYYQIEPRRIEVTGPSDEGVAIPVAIYSEAVA